MRPCAHREQLRSPASWAAAPGGLFPEGTTTDGNQVHPFHAALLQPAIDAGAPISPWPCAIACRTAVSLARRPTTRREPAGLPESHRGREEIVARIHVLPQLATTELPTASACPAPATIVERIAGC